MRIYSRNSGTRAVTRCVLGGVVIASVLAAAGTTPRADPGNAASSQLALTGATIDRTYDASIAGTSLSYTRLEGDLSEPAVSVRLDLHAQYVHGQSGVYGAFCATRFSADQRESETSAGNAELGGLYVARAFRVPVVLRVGLVLATANRVEDADTSRSTGYHPRLTDLSLAYPETNWMRLSMSPLVREGRFVARADLGLDVPLDRGRRTDSYPVEPWRNIDSLLRFNLAAGADLGVASIVGELVTVAETGYQPAGDRFFHTLALTGRGRFRTVEPYVSAIYPVDPPMIDPVWDASWIVMAGVDSALP